MKRPVFLCCCAVLLIFSLIQADVPQRTSFQGILNDSMENPLDGTFDLTFRIYDDSTGGSLLYEETHNSVPVDNGLFSVLIGGKSIVGPYDDYLFDGPDRYLGIQVNAEPEISPRTRLTTSPYSFRTGSIDGASGGIVSGDVQVDGSVHSTFGGFQFPDNSVQTSAALGIPVARTDWVSPYWQNAAGFEIYSQVAVYNTSNVSCTVTVSFYDNDGDLAGECGVNLGSNSVWIVGSSSALTNPCTTNDAYGHIEINASEPVAVWGALYKFNSATTTIDMGVPLVFFAP